jgi:hypothetical protein
MTIAWRLKSHAKVIDKHLNSGEKILYVFPGQKSDNPFSMCNTYIFAFTNKRIILATKGLLFGYFFKSITPDMYNDLTVNKGMIWGSVTIDTIKEVIHISNVDVKALDEIETNISEIMIKHRKEYANNEKQSTKI